MKLALAILATSTLVACSQGSIQSSPTAAPPPGSSTTFLWGMVVDESGVCVADATIEVVGGQDGCN